MLSNDKRLSFYSCLSYKVCLALILLFVALKKLIVILMISAHEFIYEFMFDIFV